MSSFITGCTAEPERTLISAAGATLALAISDKHEIAAANFAEIKNDLLIEPSFLVLKSGQAMFRLDRDREELVLDSCN
jgi:hypothetical protein